MRNNYVLVAVLLALVAIGCQPAEAPAPAESAMSDEDRIQEQIDAFVSAWAGGDAESIGALFAQGGDLVDPVGVTHQGKEAIVARYTELFQTMYQGTSIALTRSSTRFLTPDVAVTDGTYEIRGMKTADGAEMPPMKGLYTNIAVKQEGSWLIHCSRPMMPVKQPGT